MSSSRGCFHESDGDADRESRPLCSYEWTFKVSATLGSRSPDGGRLLNTFAPQDGTSLLVKQEEHSGALVTLVSVVPAPI